MLMNHSISANASSAFPAVPEQSLLPQGKVSDKMRGKMTTMEAQLQPQIPVLKEETPLLWGSASRQEHCCLLSDVSQQLRPSLACHSSSMLYTNCLANPSATVTTGKLN